MLREHGPQRLSVTVASSSDAIPPTAGMAAAAGGSSKAAHISAAVGLAPPVGPREAEGGSESPVGRRSGHVVACRAGEQAGDGCRSMLLMRWSSRSGSDSAEECRAIPGKLDAASCELALDDRPPSSLESAFILAAPLLLLPIICASACELLLRAN